MEKILISCAKHKKKMKKGKKKGHKSQATIEHIYY